MCGIAGCLGQIPPDRRRIKAALDSMNHRGPDGQGVYSGRLGDKALTLLHTRLAIIDLTPRAKQPFEIDGLKLVYNGEVYNYKEVRKDLEKLGHTFKTTSDTEVLILAWREWGEGALDRLEGMWAFALLDEAESRLVLCRDRFGEKPLLTMEAGGNFYFASEVRTLAALSGRHPQVNQDHVRRMLVNDSRAHFKDNETYFVDMEELPSSTIMSIDPNGKRTSRRYWDLKYVPRSMSAQEAVEGVRQHLFEALRIRLRSDVPLAFCLSGGIDSNVLTGIAAKHFNRNVKTFSIIDSDPRYDESEFINTTVDFWGADSYVHHAGKTGFFKRMRRMVNHRHEPVLTVPAYVHSFLVDVISENGIKVVLSGGGADEIFTGYYDHYNFWLADTHGCGDFPKLVAEWRESYGKAVKNPYLKDPLVFVKQPGLRDHLQLDMISFNEFLVDPIDLTFSEDNYSDNTLRNRLFNELWKEVVPVMLRNDDYNSMMVSVENRSPYLDRNLSEFLCTVPNEHLIRDGYPKWLLRMAGEGIVPDKVRLNLEKRGFNVSIDTLIDRSDPETRDYLLAESPIFELVNRNAIQNLLNHDHMENSFAKFLFGFISIKMFLEGYTEPGGFAYGPA